MKAGRIRQQGVCDCRNINTHRDIYLGRRDGYKPMKPKPEGTGIYSIGDLSDL